MGKERWVKGKVGTETLQVWWYGAAGHDMPRIRVYQNLDKSWCADFGYGQMPIEGAEIEGGLDFIHALVLLGSLAGKSGEIEALKMMDRAHRAWAGRS